MCGFSGQTLAPVDLSQAEEQLGLGKEVGQSQAAETDEHRAGGKVQPPQSESVIAEVPLARPQRAGRFTPIADPTVPQISPHTCLTPQPMDGLEVLDAQGLEAKVRRLQPYWHSPRANQRLFIHGRSSL